MATNLNSNFYNWFQHSKVADDNGHPTPVYHQTDKHFNQFNLKKAYQGIIWFTSDPTSETGANGRSKVLELYARINNPAGWDEYDKYGLDELYHKGFDGVILPDEKGGFDGFVFDANQLKSTNNVGTWSVDSDKLKEKA